MVSGTVEYIQHNEILFEFSVFPHAAGQLNFSWTSLLCTTEQISLLKVTFGFLAILRVAPPVKSILSSLF